MGLIGMSGHRKMKKRPKKPRKGKKHAELGWIKTGIPGFDELLVHGIPKGANILISGGPGTGKTIFCLQTLYNLARRGYTCLYTTFEESPERLKAHMRGFGWDVDAVKKEGTFTIRRMDPFKTAKSVEALLEQAAGTLPIEIKEVQGVIPQGLSPQVIALDSISALESAFTGKSESYRIYIEQLFRFFEKAGVTTFLVTESVEAPKVLSKTGVEEFLADGAFVLYYFRLRGIRMRAIEILKLRGADHAHRIVPISISRARGLEVLPREHLYGIEE